MGETNSKAVRGRSSIPALGTATGEQYMILAYTPLRGNPIVSLFTVKIFCYDQTESQIRRQQSVNELCKILTRTTLNN